jgi:hypothetical protein
MPDKTQSLLVEDMTTNEVFKLFIVLNPVLLGAYLMWYHTIFSRWPGVKIISACLILISWTAAITGAIPSIWTSQTMSDEWLGKYRRNRLRVAVWTLVFAFLIFMVLQVLGETPL